MTNEELIKGLYSIRVEIECHKDFAPEQAENQLSVIDKVIADIQKWQELKETITELRDSDGTLSQQEVCQFLVRYMEVLENNEQN